MVGKAGAPNCPAILQSSLSVTKAEGAQSIATFSKVARPADTTTSVWLSIVAVWLGLPASCTACTASLQTEVKSAVRLSPLSLRNCAVTG